MGAWDMIGSTDYMNDIDSTRYFKLKHFLDGLINKFKALLCSCGDKHLEGVDLLETYSLVEKYTTPA